MSHIDKIARRARSKYLSTLPLAALRDRLAARPHALILSYHAFSEQISDYPYRTRADAFDAHLSFLSEIYTLLPLVDVVQELKRNDGEATNRSIAAITFDDGYRDNLTIATPVLEKHDCPATLFALKDVVRRGGETYLNEEELRSLGRHPLWSIGAHGVTHNVLPGLLQDDQEREMIECKEWLAGCLEAPVPAFAYPQGQISETTIALARRHFDFALSTDRCLASAFDDHQIRRYCPMKTDDDLRSFAISLLEWRSHTLAPRR